MNDISMLQLCADFLKAYLTNPIILILFILLILAAGVSLRFKKIEKSIAFNRKIRECKRGL